MQIQIAEMEARAAAESVPPTNELATKDDLNRFATKQGLSELKNDLDRLAEKAATKDDLKGFATKEDLKRFATKEDLNRFATKDDLNRLAEQSATKEGLSHLEKRLDKVDETLKIIIEKINSLENNIGNRTTALETSMKIIMWGTGIVVSVISIAAVTVPHIIRYFF